MTSNDNLFSENCSFLHENIGDIIKNHLLNCFHNTINGHLKNLIKDRIIELVSGMVSDFRKDEFRINIDMQMGHDENKYLLKIQIIPTHPYAEMILKTKNFHILSRKLKIKEILS